MPLRLLVVPWQPGVDQFQKFRHCSRSGPVAVKDLPAFAPAFPRKLRTTERERVHGSGEIEFILPEQVVVPGDEGPISSVYATVRFGSSHRSLATTIDTADVAGGNLRCAQSVFLRLVKCCVLVLSDNMQYRPERAKIQQKREIHK